jgi:hypothetical protein
VTDIDDVELGRYLAYTAFVEIRYLAAGNPAGPDGPVTPAERLERIRLLADLAHNLPLARDRRSRRDRLGRVGRRERAMHARPMSWVWETANAEMRAWITKQIENAGWSWTPPPPIPVP